MKNLLFLLMLPVSFVWAQGWEGHPKANQVDPFAHMTHICENGAECGCCSGTDCGYTEECVTKDNQNGVVGPGGGCFASDTTSQETRHCAAGGTTACFIGTEADPQLICVCRGGI